MANDFKFTFTTKNNSYYLCIYKKGTKRAYMQVPNLLGVNYDHWNKYEQCFDGITNADLRNNAIIDELKKALQGLVESFNPSTPQELKTLYLSCSGKVLTLGDFLLNVIEEMKSGKDNKKPSKNYQNYKTLWVALCDEGHIVEKPLQEIDNNDFKRFGKYLLSLSTKKKNNYEALMKRFKSVHRKAYEQDLNTNILNYPYAKYAPTKETKERSALTEKQYNKFVNYDLDKIKSSGVNQAFYKELYRDFCVFMYESKMRPCDLIKLRHSNITTDKQHFCYEVEKKKNSKKQRERQAYTTITPAMKEIIKKYRNKSQQGYIFPFSMNDYNWDMADACSWNKWHNRKQRQLEMINAFLHKFENILGVDELTLYSFRHSRFTHALNMNGCNYMQLAKEGATSIKMFEEHYYHLM